MLKEDKRQLEAMVSVYQTRFHANGSFVLKLHENGTNEI